MWKEEAINCSRKRKMDYHLVMLANMMGGRKRRVRLRKLWME